jgi:hypothetical protein
LSPILPREAPDPIPSNSQKVNKELFNSYQIDLKITSKMYIIPYIYDQIYPFRKYLSPAQLNENIKGVNRYSRDGKEPPFICFKE